MKISKTDIEGVLVIEPRVFEDERGYFFESYNQAKMVEAGLNYNFIQVIYTFQEFSKGKTQILFSECSQSIIPGLKFESSHLIGIN